MLQVQVRTKDLRCRHLIQWEPHSYPQQRAINFLLTEETSNWLVQI